MPGIIRVSVLEVVDLPEVFTDGTTLTGVTAKVTLGPQLFKTQPGVADGGRIETWNSNFAFPVMNLRDKLVVSICDSEDQSVTQTAIEIPSIIQKGSRDEFVSLNKGGRIHLRMSFALTDDERKKIEAMRLAALKRRAEVERLAKTVVFQPVQESLLELKQSPILVEANADVDVSTAYEKGVSKTQPNRSLGLDSSPTSPAPEQEPEPSPKSVLRPVFDYKKAIGLQSGLESMERRSIVLIPENLVTEVAASNGNVNSGVQRTEDVVEVDAFGTTKLDASSPASSGCLDGSCPLATKSVHDITQSNLPPAGEADSLMNEAKPYNIENGAEVGPPENAQLHVLSVSSTCSDGPVSLVKTKPQCNTPMAENLNYEVEAKNRDSNSEAETVSESAENAGSSGASVLNISPVTELEAAASSIESPSKKPGQPSAISFSGSVTWKAVKARVKRTSPNFFYRRSSRSASGRTGVAVTPPPVPVVWLQDWVRTGLSNIKGCFTPAYPIQQLQHK